MTALRSTLYLIWFVAWTAVIWIGFSPIFLAPRRWTAWSMGLWAKGLQVGLWAICGVRTEVRGLERLPKGAALIAAKHQCMFDTVAPFHFMRDACFVMKKDLMIIPLYGWYAAKNRMIVVDREGHSKALRAMLADTRERIADGRQVIIYPEGTRGPPGAAPDYKPGIAGLYRDLELPCIPMATNSGVHWPAHGFMRHPGTIVFEFLPAIPPGLKRADFMRTLEDRIETASRALLAD